MEYRKCIVCYKTKHETSFNKEHVIPAAIGGALKIWHVCTTCNSEFGENIDEPFTNNNSILLYRNQLNIGREGQTRSIGNPFKKEYYDNKGNPNVVTFEDRKIVTKVRDVVKFHPEGVNGPTLTIKTDANRKDEVLEVARKQLIKKGYDPAKFKMSEPEIDENIGGTVEIGFGADGKEITLECMKIAYETVCCLFPAFVGHPDARALLIDLKSKKVSDDDDKQNQLRTFFENKFAKVPKLNLVFHAINIQIIENIGLVCAVKLFDLIYVVELSKHFQPIEKEQEIFIWNDSEEVSFNANISFKPKVINFQMDLFGVNNHTRQLLNNAGDNALVKADNQVTLFLNRIDYPHMNLDRLCDILVQYHKQHIFSLRPASFNVRDKAFYVKTITGIFIPVTVIKTELTRVIHPIMQFQ